MILCFSCCLCCHYDIILLTHIQCWMAEMTKKTDVRILQILYKLWQRVNLLFSVLRDFILNSILDSLFLILDSRFAQESRIVNRVENRDLQRTVNLIFNGTVLEFRALNNQNTVALVLQEKKCKLGGNGVVSKIELYYYCNTITYYCRPDLEWKKNPILMLLYFCVEVSL